MGEESVGEKRFEAVEAELNAERAAVLGRYGQRVEKALAACRQRQAELDVDDHESLAAYRSARERVLEAIADLCFQREMIGLTDHSWVHRVHPAPPQI